MTDPEFRDVDPGYDPTTDPAEQDIEVPDADALEQRIPADPSQEAGRPEPSRSLEAPDWDSLEQAEVVGLDEDY
jgi:hypothetical protein